MTITSSRFDSQDQVFFNENFKIKDKSPEVNSLEDADVIFLGDKHTVENQRIKNRWLIHKQARKGDTVFNEEYPGRNGDPLHFELPSRIYVHGWDSLEIRGQFDTLEAMICKGLSILERIPRSNAEMTEVKEALRAANSLIPLHVVEDLEEQIKHLKKPKDYQSPLNQRKLCNDIAQKAETAQTIVELEPFLVSFISSITGFWISFLLDSIHLGCIQRNISLGQKVVSEIKGKVLATAGKTHLHRPRNPSLGDVEAIKKLKEILNKHGKKYIILFPKGNDNVDHAKKFLEQQKPGIFIRIFHLFKFNITLSLSIFLFSIAPCFPGIKFYIISSGRCMCALKSIQFLYLWYKNTYTSHKTVASIVDRRSALLSKLRKKV